MNEHTSIKNIEFDLLENGLDFVLSSLDPILERNEEYLKYSILHLSAGVELILKERLRQEHWSLIFENINLASTHKFTSGDFVSVNLESCLVRLEDICGVELKEKEKNIFRELKKRRNRIEHFVVKEINASIKSLVSKVLSTLLSFILANFDQNNISKQSKEQIEALRSKLRDFTEFITIRLAQIKEKLEAAKEANKEVLKCPKCYQVAFPLDDNLSCLFCGYNNTVEEVAQEYIESILNVTAHSIVNDGGKYPLDFCPECSSETLVHDGKRFVCFNCSTTYSNNELNECGTCGSLYLKGDDDMDICDTCIEGLYHRFGEK